jgi:hypothetical protein
MKKPIGNFMSLFFFVFIYNRISFYHPAPVFARAYVILLELSAKMGYDRFY